jgi:hypothetical protein
MQPFQIFLILSMIKNKSESSPNNLSRELAMIFLKIIGDQASY